MAYDCDYCLPVLHNSPQAKPREATFQDHPGARFASFALDEREMHGSAVGTRKTQDSGPIEFDVACLLPASMPTLPYFTPGLLHPPFPLCIDHTCSIATRCVSAIHSLEKEGTHFSLALFYAIPIYTTFALIASRQAAGRGREEKQKQKRKQKQKPCEETTWSSPLATASSTRVHRYTGPSRSITLARCAQHDWETWHINYHIIIALATTQEA